jgi:hypothetical protein
VSLDLSLGGITGVSNLQIRVYCLVNTCKSESFYASATPAFTNTNSRMHVRSSRNLIWVFPPNPTRYLKLWVDAVLHPVIYWTRSGQLVSFPSSRIRTLRRSALSLGPAAIAVPLLLYGRSTHLKPCGFTTDRNSLKVGCTDIVTSFILPLSSFYVQTSQVMTISSRCLRQIGV